MPSVGKNDVMCCTTLGVYSVSFLLLTCCAFNLYVSSEAILQWADTSFVFAFQFSQINESNYGREHVIPSIVQFGFALLEGIEDGSKKGLSKADGLLGTEELGMEMLKSSFEVHDMARKEIIEQCKFRILSSKPHQALPILRLFEHLIKGHPNQMLDYVAHLKELLDYFTFTDAKVSSQVVSVLLPLTKFSPDLQDYMVLVLRKAMFRREDSVRLAATNSIISLILAEKQRIKDGPFSFQESSSQASCSQQAEIPCIKEAGLFRELSGLLQRCLYQQAKVREVLYHGLVKLVLADPLSAGSVFDFLLPHFLRYYREDAEILLDITHSLKSDNGKLYIGEPLDSLLSCVSWILLLQPQDKADQPRDSWASFGFSLTQENEAGRTISGETFSNALSKIRKFLRQSNLEGLLGKTCDSESSTSEEKNSSFHAVVLLGIIEVVLNIIINELEKGIDLKKVELQKELLDFVNIHNSLEKFTSTSRQARKTVRPTASDLVDKFTSSGHTLPQGRISFLATSSIHYLLQKAPEQLQLNGSAHVTSQNNSQLSSSKASDGNSKMFLFMLHICLHQLTSLPFAEREDSLWMLVYGEIKLLGPPLLKLVLLLTSAPDNQTSLIKNDTKKKKIDDRKEYIHLALMCLKNLITSTLGTPGYSEFIEDMMSLCESELQSRGILDADGTYEYGTADSRVDHSSKSDVMFIRKCMVPLVIDLLKVSLFREVEVICDIIMMIGNQIPADCQGLVGAWILRICKISHLQNSKVARSLVSLVVSLSLPPNDLIISEDLASELLKVVGSEATEPEDVSEKFHVLNKATHAAIASSILQLLESNITDMDSIINKLIAYSTAARKGVSLDPNRKIGPRLALEESLYSRMQAVVKVLSYFVLMNLKDPQAEHFLSLAAKLYKDLARVAKLQISPRGCIQALPSLKYQKLVEITCRQLTAPLYKFMDMVQKNQQECTNTKGMASKIRRENKCIPDLIFQIEDYEKYLILLSKATKTNLLRYAKRSTSRDFKILDTKDFAMEEEEEEEERNGDNEENAAEGDEPSEEECGEEREEGNGGVENVLSPESEVPTAAEDSVSDDDEGEDKHPNGVRSKRRRVVKDESDDEEMASGQSLAF
ncbi:OLC1v1020477C2 [Oldenlandia corymbosa var. corymbosa]|uniref:OLC1v1020477C2 n=1 Tax=Oldenlandia corymbosa var. corymbosa TaxID=529605 RepID=A0AAV1EGH4_OLDCO|nr:OLC1v1020477C2 [Oldenlandia corymbosa var. corymbosa]